MKRILILFAVGMLFLQTACGMKKEEEKKEEPTNNTQEENKTELMDEDYKQITSSMETREKSDTTSVVKITYKNESPKDFNIKTITIIVKKDNKQILSKTKEVNDTVPAKSSKTYEIEIEMALEKLVDESINIDWEIKL